MAEVKLVEMWIVGYLCGDRDFNIQKAVSRLDRATKLKDIRIRHQEEARVFTPKLDKRVSFAALKSAIKVERGLVSL